MPTHAARLGRATAAYITRLTEIADIRTLTAGSHDFTYAITVPQNEKLAMLPRLADLTMDIEDDYGVKITTLAVAGPPRIDLRAAAHRTSRASARGLEVIPRRSPAGSACRSVAPEAIRFRTAVAMSSGRANTSARPVDS